MPIAIFNMLAQKADQNIHPFLVHENEAVIVAARQWQKKLGRCRRAEQSLSMVKWNDFVIWAVSD